MGLFEVLDHVVDSPAHLVNLAINGFVEDPESQNPNSFRLHDKTTCRFIKSMEQMFEYEFPEMKPNWHIIFDLKFYPPCMQTISFFSHTQQYQEYLKLTNMYLSQVHMSIYEQQDVFRHITIVGRAELEENAPVPSREVNSIKLEFKKVKEIVQKKQRDQMDPRKPHDVANQIRCKVNEIVRLLNVEDQERDKVELQIVQSLKQFQQQSQPVISDSPEADMHSVRQFDQFVSAEIMTNINKNLERVCQERN